jgi:hypothetical protein
MWTLIDVDGVEAADGRADGIRDKAAERLIEALPAPTCLVSVTPRPLMSVASGVFPA